MQISFVLQLKPEFTNGVINSGHPVANIFATSKDYLFQGINSLNAELNPTCHLLTLLGVRHILHVSKIRVKDRDEYIIPKRPVLIILC